MSVMALTLQSGTGLGSFQSGNAFIALGAAYFISWWWNISATVFIGFGQAFTVSSFCGPIATGRHGKR